MRKENEPMALREVEHIKNLNHENINQYYFREEDNEKRFIFLALEYCEGTFADIIHLINLDQQEDIKYVNNLTKGIT